MGLRLEGDGVRVSRSAVGTRVKVSPAAPDEAGAVPPRYFEVSAGNGMSAQFMFWVFAGLGAYEGRVNVEIRWLDGSVQRLEGIDPRRYHDVRYLRASAKAVSPQGNKRTAL